MRRYGSWPAWVAVGWILSASAPNAGAGMPTTAVPPTNLNSPLGITMAAHPVVPAVVSSFATEVDEAGTLVRWRTASEIGVLSFDLYRSAGSGGAWTKVNSEIIVAANSPAGASYQTRDIGAPPGQDSVYRLVGFDQQSLECNLGIYKVSSREAAPEMMAPVVGAGEMQRVRLMAAPASAAPSANLAVTVLDETTFVKMTTTNTGLQKLTADVLAALLGQPLAEVQSAISQRQFRLANRGQPVGYLAASGGSALLFYALAYKDNYTDRNVFWLTSGSAPALITSNGQLPTANPTSIYYSMVLNQERDLLDVTSLPISPDDDFWMWSRLVAGLTFFDMATYPLMLDHVVSSPGVMGQLSFQLWGANTAAHRVQVQVNGQAVTNADWQGFAPFNLTLSVPSTQWAEGSNSVTLRALINGSASPRSQWYLNRFSLTYSRQYFAQAGLVEFTASTNSVVSLNGFTSSVIKVLDVSHPNVPILVTNVNIEPLSTTYRASFVPGSPEARYIAFQSGAGTPVASVALAEVTGLSNPTNAANYVLITPDSLLAAAANLADYRQQKGLQPCIARLDPIYNEFAYGFVTPRAIQSFLATAYTHWSVPPRYVALIGDGTYDYRNLKGNGDNLTPPLLVSTRTACLLRIALWVT